jgi:hypothetical protein
VSEPKKKKRPCPAHLVKHQFGKRTPAASTKTARVQPVRRVGLVEWLFS